MDRSATADLACLAVAAAVMAAAYCLDLAGVPFHPFVLLFLTGASGVAARVLLQPRFDAGFAAVVVVSFAYAMWLASPGFLPVTNGPDVVHHLQLIHAIARTWRLPHGEALYPYLLEMMGYTPGAHVLAAAFAKLLETDPLRVVYPITAAFVAVKAGTIYAIARRLIGVSLGSIAALAAPVLAFGTPVYFLGSFVQFFFFSQVISEAFAMGMLLALVRWLQLREQRDLVAISACAIGVVLSWPVWILPAGFTVAISLLFTPGPWKRRSALIAATLAPAGLVGTIHQFTHRGAASIVTSAGAVTTPSTAAFGIALLVLGGAGVAIARRTWPGRAVCVFLFSIVLQSLALGALAARAGSTSYYMAFKMMYLVVPPAAVLGAVALARSAAMLVEKRSRLAAAALPVALAALLVGGRIPVHRVHGSLSVDGADAALWARDHVPPACVDYFSRYWLTGYWLHLDVLGNPRLSDRMREETFDFPDVAAKWIEGRGLPYAIVEDMTAVPREIRSDMEPLQQRGAFVVVRNRRPTACR